MSEYLNNRKPSISNGNRYADRQYSRDNLRVLKKNLLFCSGLPLSLSEDQLKSDQYFGRYGKVVKIILLKNLRQLSAYITYSDVIEASLAIIATNDFEIGRYHKLASIYGTIKYCKYFLKKSECKNIPNCNYLHVLDKKNQIMVDNQLPDEVFDQHFNIAYKMVSQADHDKLILQKGFLKSHNAVLPCPIQALRKLKKQIENQKEDLVQTVLQISPKRIQKPKIEENHDNQLQIEYPKIETLKIQSPKKQAKEKKHNISQPSKQKQREKQREKRIEVEQTLQIKLIRKLVRQPKSKLNSWMDQNSLMQQNMSQIPLFHVGLSQLNELRLTVQNNRLKQINRQEQRLKFLLIKNIHHKKNEKKMI